MRVEFESHDRDSGGVRVLKGHEIKDVKVCYGSGRLDVYVNGEKVLHTALAGNDFNVTIDKRGA